MSWLRERSVVKRSWAEESQAKSQHARLRKAILQLKSASEMAANFGRRRAAKSGIISASVITTWERQNRVEYLLAAPKCQLIWLQFSSIECGKLVDNTGERKPGDTVKVRER